MSAVWTTIALLAVVNLAIKGAGPALAGGRPLPGPLTRAIDLMVPAIVAALIATGTLADGQRLVVDERLAGLAAAGLALALRGSMLVAVVAAAATTALLRAVV